MDEMVARTTELRNNLLEQKRESRGQIIQATVSNIEARQATLKGLVANIASDDKLAGMSEEVLRGTHEELTAADKAAQAALAEGKEFVTSQLKEARSMVGAERQQYTK